LNHPPQNPALHDGPRYSVFTVGTALAGCGAAFFGFGLVVMLLLGTMEEREGRRGLILDAEVTAVERAQDSSASYLLQFRFQPPDSETVQGRRAVSRSDWRRIRHASEDGPATDQVLYLGPRKWHHLNTWRRGISTGRKVRYGLAIVTFLFAGTGVFCFVMARRQHPDIPPPDSSGWRDVPEGFALTKWQIWLVAYHPRLAPLAWAMLPGDGKAPGDTLELRNQLIRKVSDAGNQPLRYSLGGMLKYHITPHFRLLRSLVGVCLGGGAVTAGSLVLMGFVAVGRAVVQIPPDTDGAEMFGVLLGVLGTLAAIGITAAVVGGVAAYRQYRRLEAEPFWSDTPIFSYWPFEMKLPPLRPRAESSSQGAR
jgi:hypothetical protein